MKSSFFVFPPVDLSDCPDVTSTANGDRSVNHQALSYSALLGENSAGVSSIETLLRNIQGLLKVAADNARQQERQINYEKGKYYTFLTCWSFDK